MKQIESLSEARISNLFEIGIKGFFEDIINDQLLEGVVRNINDWKNKTKATEITSISYNDLIIGYQIRKQALVQYIDYYSSEPQEFIVLLEELNQIINKIEEFTLQYFREDEVLRNMILVK